MKFFIGIVPPADIYNVIIDIQKKFGDNRLEPHITLRSPIELKDESNWLKAIKDVCSTFPAFDIELPSTGFFGQRVLFINTASENLYRLHDSLIPAIELFEQPEIDGSNQAYTPHLTLGRSWCGFSLKDFAEMKKLTDDFLSERSVFFRVNFIRVYYKPQGSKKYVTKEDIPLKVN